MNQPHRPGAAHHPRPRTRSRPQSIRNRKAQKSKPQKSNAQTKATARDVSANALSSINLVSVLDTFYTIRSTVKDLRVSLEKLDNTMDSAYQMFEIAQSFLNGQATSRRRSRLQLLPPPNRGTFQQRPPLGGEESTRDAPNGGSLADAFKQIDMEQIMGILQSPLVQNMINQFLQNSESSSKNTAQGKEG